MEYEHPLRFSSRHPQTKKFQSPKIISIPVHFIASDTKRSSSALKIQKLFRGFLVRKGAKKVLQIKRDVDEIERLISISQMDSILKEAKERLKINEMLMALLLRLDSVSGVVLGVRECRKAVIKKAIMLQERVDAIAAGEEEATESGGETETTTDELQITEIQRDCVESTTDKSNVTSESLNCVDEEMVETEVTKETIGEETMVEEIDLAETPMESSFIAENTHISPIPTEVMKESMAEELDLVEIDDDVEIQDIPVVLEEIIKAGNREAIRDDGNRVLMEKVMKENEKLVSMVSELSERNELQTRLLSSLTQRVENLEKSFRSEKLKCKKKRQQFTESSPNGKKLGRKS